MIKTRVSIESETFDAAGYAKVIERACSIMDDRGYAYLAGIHGYPLPVYCTHENLLFLPWHRAYLYLFERVLSEIDQNFSIPWWDFTSQMSHTFGIPEEFSKSKRGNKNNILASAPMQNLPPDLQKQFLDHGFAVRRGAIRTCRNPALPEDLPTRELIDQLLEADSFEDFSMRLEESPHNPVHMWCGGTMAAVPSAAFDPIFWSHHAMIDRLWYIWQQRHQGGTLDESLLRTILPPFNMTVADTMSIERLGYRYATDAIY